MTKKDAQQNRGTPVDQYRKNIGKQHVKIGKQDLQDVKNKKDAKESAMSIKDVLGILAAFSLLIGIIYLFLYVYLTKEAEISDNHQHSS